MRKSRFSERQIVSALKEAESGIPVRDICMRIGIHEPTFYGWRSKFSSLSESDVKRLRELEEENQHLRKVIGHKLLQLEVENSCLKQTAEKVSLDIRALKATVLSRESRPRRLNRKSAKLFFVADPDEVGRERAMPDARAGD